MSNPIPPLVCDSPPPMDDDFEPSDDDFGAFEGAEESISPREEKSSSTEAKFELPVPEIPTVVEPCEIESLPRREDPQGEEAEPPREAEENLEKSDPKDLPEEQELNLGDNLVTKRCESPPSLVLSDDFSCLPDEPQAEDSNSCDEVSLPSLHLDSSGVSKSVTPTFAPLPVPDNTDNFVISEDDKVAHDESFDDFVEFTSAPDTGPETLPAADFVGFSAPKAVESVSIASAEEVVDFVADFSQFEEPPATVVVSDSENQSTRDNMAADDDEFGDFSDFQQLEAATTAVIDTTNLNSQFLSALDLMFPKVPDGGEEESQVAQGAKIDTELTQKSQILEDLRDFEASKALQYQWLNSSSNQYLIRSLGIDSRNILYGGKWNSSMPRFAANLGFSPLQPMKPGGACSSASHHREGSEAMSHSLPTGVSEVPAAQFDWTSSGLVNPLDASQAHTLLLDLEQLVVVANLDKIKLDSSSCSVASHETPADILADVGSSTMGHLININSSNKSSCDGLDWSIFDNFNTISSNAFASNGDGFTNKYPNKHLHNSFDTFLDISAPKVLPKPDDSKDQKEQPESSPTAEAAAAAATADDSEPQPGDFHVAKEVSAVRPASTTILPQTFNQPLRETHIFTPSKSSNPISRDVSEHVAESKIVVKEYRDVEYNPEKVRVDDDFSDFAEYKNTTEVKAVVEQRNPPTESPYRAPEKVIEYTKPTFGVSPTEEMVNGVKVKEEDDFSDFQSVTPVTPHSTSQMPVLQPLSVMQLPGSSPKIAWPSPGINPDELARLEAIYPQKKAEKVAIIEAKAAEKGKDEDEWSDFVSGNISTANRDDDWTDFMSGAPPQKSLQQGPNFSSWTTPQLPPPQFSAWHNSNIFNPPQFGGSGVHRPVPAMNNNNHMGKGVNNGQINGFPVNPSLATISSANQGYSSGRRMTRDSPSISVIPDMSFRAPKSLINLPRSSFAKK